MTATSAIMTPLLAAGGVESLIFVAVVGIYVVGWVLNALKKETPPQRPSRPTGASDEPMVVIQPPQMRVPQPPRPPRTSVPLPPPVAGPPRPLPSRPMPDLPRPPRPMPTSQPAPRRPVPPIGRPVPPRPMRPSGGPPRAPTVLTVDDAEALQQAQQQRRLQAAQARLAEERAAEAHEVTETMAQARARPARAVEARHGAVEKRGAVEAHDLAAQLRHVLRSRTGMRGAVLLAEILGPPVSLRGDHLERPL